MQSKNWLKGEQGWNTANGTHKKPNAGLRKQDPRIRNKKEEDSIGSRTTKQKSGSAARNESELELVAAPYCEAQGSCGAYYIPNSRAAQDFISLVNP